MSYNHLASGIINHSSLCLWIKLFPKQLISIELFKFPLLEITQNNGHQWSRYVAGELIRSHVCPFDSFTICACSSVTQQHFYDSTPVPAEFIVSSLKCCLGVLLGGSVLSPFILFCSSSNIHFMPSVRASRGCGDHGWSYSACCKFPSGEMMDPAAITQRGQGWMEWGWWWQTDLYKNWGGIVWAAGSRPPFIKPLILQAINYSG